jgi:glucosamine 6-phosphate synthetase-like amidotransferase/phosphosugar isomerase protein
MTGAIELTACRRGRRAGEHDDVDQLRNLAKSVTVE